MGGFAALLGGLGAGAQDYGRQVRTIQEQQRESYMGMLQNEAQQESDPEHRSNLYQGLADLASGKPVSYVNKNIAKSRQKRDQADFEAGAPHVQAAVQGLLANQSAAPPPPGQYAGIPPGMLPPGAAAQPQTSPVNPLLQMGQQAGALSPQLPEAGAQPWAYTPEMAGTTLPPSEEQAAGLEAALPQAGPQAGAQMALPQAGPQEDIFSNLPYDPMQDVAKMQNLRRNVTPAMWQSIGPDALQAMQYSRQFGLARNEMEIKNRAFPRIVAPIKEIIQDPNVDPMMKAIAQEQLALWESWRVTSGQAPPSGTMSGAVGMMRANQPVLKAVDTASMPEPLRQQLNVPEGFRGMAWVSHSRWTGQPQAFDSPAPGNIKEGDFYDKATGQVFHGIYNLATPDANPALVAGRIPAGFGGFMTGTTGTGQIGVVPKASFLGPPASQIAGPQGWVGALQAMRPTPFYNPSIFPQVSEHVETVEGAGGKPELKAVQLKSQKIPPVTAATGAAIGGGLSARSIGIKPLTQQDVLHSYQQTSNQLTKLYNPELQLLQRAQRLTDNLDKNNPQADALLAPELLTVTSGGAGSGLRMNETELARIVGGRSIWETLKAKLNQVQLDPEKANSITLAQRNQMRAIINEINKRSQARMDIITEAQSDLVNSTTVDEHKSILANAQKQLVGTALPEATGGGAGGMVTMRSPDGKTTKQVPSNQVEHYKSLGATVVQ